MAHLKNHKVFELPRLYFHFLYQTASEFRRLTFNKGSLVYIKVEKRTLVFSDFCCQHLIKIKPIFSPHYLKIHL